MPHITTENLTARLEKAKPFPVLLLLGDEPYIRGTWRTQIVDKLIPDAARDWAVCRYSADRGETGNALQQAQSLPMLSSRQVIFLQDVEKIEKLGEKSREAAIKELEAYLENPAPFTLLVLEATVLDQRMKLAKLLTEKAQVLEIGLGEDPEQRQAAAVRFASVIAKEQKVEFDPGAAEDLAEYVAADLMRLRNEIMKLADVCRRSQADHSARCQRPGHLRKNYDRLGVGRSHRHPRTEESSRVSRSAAARRRRTAAYVRCDHLDVSEIDRSQRPKRRQQWLPGCSRTGHESGTRRGCPSECAQNLQAASARRAACISKRRRPPQRWPRRRTNNARISNYPPDHATRLAKESHRKPAGANELKPMMY